MAISVQKRLALIRSMPRTLTPEERIKKTITDVGKGGFIRVKGVLYKVEEINRYEEKWEGKTDKWYELKVVSLKDGEVLFLEWDYDDELEVYLYTKSSLREIGLTKKQLEEMDDEEEGEFLFRGMTFEYDDSGKVKFFRDNGRDGEKFYNWDFFNQPEEDWCIGVERWGGSEFDVSIGNEVDEPEEEIEVLVAGEKGGDGNGE